MQQEINFSDVHQAPPPKVEKTFHWRALRGSRPLRQLLRILLDGQKHSTLNLVHEAGIPAINAAVPELRCNGVIIRGAWAVPTPGEKRRYEYWIETEDLGGAMELLHESLPSDEKVLDRDAINP